MVGDIDAGVRTSHIDRAKRTGVRERIRQHDAGTYRRLIPLAQDLAPHGSLHERILSTSGLSEIEPTQVIATACASALLCESCRFTRRVRFDLQLKSLVRDRKVVEARAHCDNLAALDALAPGPFRKMPLLRHTHAGRSTALCGSLRTSATGSVAR